MNHRIKYSITLFLIGALLIFFPVSALAAKVRRVPEYDLVEQGFMALTLDAEGTENFRYTGKENKLHTYRGKIKSGAKLKFVVEATLGSVNTLPLTGRNYSVRMEVVAKKGKDIVKKQNFKTDNKSNLDLDYTVPEGADTLEVSETFVLVNKSKNKAYNKSFSDRSKLILTTNDVPAAVAANTGKTNGGKSVADSSNLLLFAGAAALAAVMGCGFLFMKKKRDNKNIKVAANQNETLRQQAMWPQQETPQDQIALGQYQEDQRRQAMQLQEEMHHRQEAVRQNDNQFRHVTVKKQLRFCSNCGAQLLPDSLFCENCGAKDASGFCMNCGEKLEPGSAFCGNCGAKNMPEFCMNCGEKLEPGSAFCGNCGAKV